MTQHAALSSDVLARWECTTVQNLDPVLSDDDSAALWSAIVALRSSGDPEAFAKDARAIVATASPFVRDTMERALEELAILSAAAAAAKE